MIVLPRELFLWIQVPNQMIIMYVISISSSELVVAGPRNDMIFCNYTSWAEGVFSAFLLEKLHRFLLLSDVDNINFL